GADESTVLVSSLGLPGHHAVTGTAGGNSLLEHSALSRKSVPSVDRLEELGIIYPEGRLAALAEVLDAQTDHCAADKQRIHDHHAIATALGLLLVEVQRVEVQRERGEEQVVRISEGSTPVVVEHLPYGEALVRRA